MVATAQSFLVEHARRRVADLKRAARLPGEVTPADEKTWRYLFEKRMRPVTRRVLAMQLPEALYSMVNRTFRAG